MSEYGQSAMRRLWGKLVEIAFPVEFVVEGTPVSHQAKRAESRAEWKQLVKDASCAALPSPHFASEGRMAVTIYYFPPEPMQGDIDNIVKPILDALCHHIYIDDQQVERVVVQKFEPGNVFAFTDPSPVFGKALGAQKPMLYVRVSAEPHEDLVG